MNPELVNQPFTLGTAPSRRFEYEAAFQAATGCREKTSLEDSVNLDPPTRAKSEG